MNQHFITGVHSPHSLAISGNYIYFDERLNDTIGRARLDGTHVDNNLITTGVSDPWGTRPMAPTSIGRITVT